MSSPNESDWKLQATASVVLHRFRRHARASSVASVRPVVVPDRQTTASEEHTDHQLEVISPDRYIVIHSETEKWFGCRSCDALFQQWSGFVIHAETHAKGFMSEQQCDQNNNYNNNNNNDSLTNVLVYDTPGWNLPVRRNSKKATKAQFECSYCMQHFSTKAKLIAHNRTYHETKELSCAKCCIRFRHVSLLYDHLRLHVGLSRPYKCSVCNMKFEQSRELGLHAKQHSVGSATKLFACGECDSYFAALPQLRRHVGSNHLTDLPFSCSLCAKRYSRRDHLLRHQRTTHGNKRPFSCHHCQWTFKDRQYLRAHVTTVHSEDKDRHECSVCRCLFASRSQQKLHMLKEHEIGTWHTCKICNKSYVWENELRRHLLGHARTSPYVCGRCPRAFRSRSGRRAHAAMIHGSKSDICEKNYVCDCCFKDFSCSRYLKRHRKSHH